eukprot:TRINITY_DN109486_c0_g1_i1.p1 TRINITY_DN109486_c0_g1~~TRINITY_DN109486_c0_g1_i1.p1  ORF type:complete len:272 (+),score=42.34 TRINITY_DN109486_c0_g1_i1:46-816(+)
MACCPTGRASVCFPLCISSQAAHGVIAAGESLKSVAADVVGLTTVKTFEAGAQSVRLRLRESLDGVSANEEVAHLVLLRASGSRGWLPGLAGMRQYRLDSEQKAMEVVVLARPDSKMNAVMYLPEATLNELFPSDAGVEVRFLRELLPVQRDCPGQWLRDRLLRLADMVETEFEAVPCGYPSLKETLETAGLKIVQEGHASERQMPVLPADSGDRISPAELGFWNEEMNLNTRCGATVPGEKPIMRPDFSFGLDGQ